MMLKILMAASLAAVSLSGGPLTPVGLRGTSLHGADAGAASGPVPVASFNFNDGGTTIVDRTGNGHTGTCSTCPVWGAATGRNSDGSFTWTDSASMVISIDGSTLDMHSNNAFTIAYDTKITDIGALGAVFRRALQFRLGAVILSPHVYVVTDTAISGTPAVSTTGAEFDGSWHHVAAVFDGSTWTLYVDSVLSVQKTGLAGTLGANTDDVTLGLTGIVAGFTGTLDNLRLYDVALSVSEIGDIDGVDVSG